jgi:uncharacterized protein
LKIKLSNFLGNHGKKIEFDYIEDQIHIKGFAQDMEDFILVEGNFQAKVLTQCVRCLREIELDVDGKFYGKFKDQKQYKEYLSTLKEECEVDIQDSVIQEAVNGEIDITALVKEYVLLEMDPYPSCTPECEDDSELSKYMDNGVDPRWQELLKIKI